MCLTAPLLNLSPGLIVDCGCVCVYFEALTKRTHKLSIGFRSKDRSVPAREDNYPVIITQMKKKQLCLVSLPLVNDLEVSPLEEVAGTWLTGQH